MITAKDIMTTDVVTVDPETSVKEAANLMSEKDISGLPVVQNGELVGIVTENDLIIKDKKLHFPEYINVIGGIIYLESYKKFREEFKKFVAVKVKELMTEDVVTVSPDTSIEDLATIMHQENINRLPVVDNSGQLIGIVTRGNIVKHIAVEE
ncbi:MAG TPA: CBS domain-containing protein [Halanaerobiales bacterium]|nr:CBS domain-containing protein [Halanaerobiales bacterium]